ncbi:MAG: co-chaperone GroES [Calditrichia bacterium]
MKELVVIGDRVLIKEDDSEQRTKVGLYLPQTVKEKEQVAGGYILKTGPGIPLADPSSLGEEPWLNSPGEKLTYLPMEARPGDYALFLKKASVEINYKNEKYLIVPQGAILVLIRDDDEIADSAEPDFHDPDKELPL